MRREAESGEVMRGAPAAVPPNASGERAEPTPSNGRWRWYA